MKKFILLLTLFISIYATAQNRHNSWINYSMDYYKFQIVEDGVYKINYNDLQSAGVLTNNPDPRSFQIFNKGIEIAIYVFGENDAVFDTEDYIILYAKKNNAEFDTNLFDNPQDLCNINYSYINDTASYFFTFNPSWTINPSKRLILENDQNFSSYTPLNYTWFTSRTDYTSNYFTGETTSIGNTQSTYHATEGWFDAGFSHGNNISKTIDNDNVYITGPQSEIEFTLIGESNYALFSPNHDITISFAGVTIDTTFDGYVVAPFKRIINSSLLGSNNTLFSFSSNYNSNNGADRNTISHIQIKYPHTNDLNNRNTYKFSIPYNASSTKHYTDFTNFNAASGISTFIIDLSNNKIISCSNNGTNVKALIPNSLNEQECILFSDASTKSISTINTISSNNKFVDYTETIFDNSNYIIISGGDLMTEAENYKNYRISTGHKVLLVDIKELYDQYSYGIGKHPLAIRNFIGDLVDNYTNPPEFLFLMGKTYTAASYRKNTTYYEGSIIPSFGYPASDILLTAKIVDNQQQPALGIGRLAAKTPTHMQWYLEKITEYEIAQQTPQDWMKQILHNGGGASTSEQSTFAAYLRMYENIIEDDYFGGNVHTFLKTSSAPIQINTSDSLRTLINNGVSLMTFFGHAAGIGFDQSIDQPSAYENEGKYSFLLANSCYAGDIFGAAESSSEAFILIERKGCIGYLATITEGTSYHLNQYSSLFYEKISNSMYGEPIGTITKSIIATIQNPNDPLLSNICLGMTLHGDPALKLNPHSKPDYTLNNEGISLNPSIISNVVDTFDIEIVCKNIGKAIVDDIFLDVKRYFPDNSIKDTTIRIIAPLYSDTINIRLAVDISNALGLNKIEAFIDSYNEIDEINENNNKASINFLVISNDIVPIWPPEYSVIPDINPTLKASTGNPLANINTYIFEADTSDTFNSPHLTTTNITQAGGIVEWTPNLPITTDSIVYYWRVCTDTTASARNWYESSFQYIDDKRGWGQAHFYQFKNDGYQFLEYNRTQRKWDFVNSIRSIYLHTGYYPYTAWNDITMSVDGSVIGQWHCGGPSGNGFKFAVMNNISGDLWVSTYNGTNIGSLGDLHCKAYDTQYFDFYTHSQSERDKIVNFIDNIPDGFYIFGYSHRNHYAESYDANLIEAFRSIGGNGIQTLIDDTPYAFLGVKGDTNSLRYRDVIGLNINDKITLDDTVTSVWKNGIISSTTIGPSSRWESLHYKQNSIDANNFDIADLSVVGIKDDGQKDTLIKYNNVTLLNEYNLNNLIDASIYPNIELNTYFEDTSNFTPAQMDRWQVLFTGVPETALDPNSFYSFKNDTVQEGENIVLSIATNNISAYDMDSLLIRYWIVDNSGNSNTYIYHRLRPHPSGDILIDTVNISSYGLSGNNSLWVEVNPDNDQLEQSHFNNLAEIRFFVKSDKINPILDVTFDGFHIMDGDIVSAKPQIQISLDDENQFLAIDDTSSFQVFLKSPNQSSSQRIYFINGLGEEVMIFYPASLPQNRCLIEYQPEQLEDGIYELIVYANDASDNESGTYSYTVNFEVINEQTITNVLNWPNPFTTSTQFVFTLTGSEIPTEFKIQILTISGKIVKEIDLNELGSIHIGKNITNYAWDGTDQYGDRLANGVYLYRVYALYNGADINLRYSGASEYFTKEYGKMYLMR